MWQPVLELLCYTVAIWATWSLLNWIFRWLRPKNTICSVCDRKQKRIDALEKQLKEHPNKPENIEKQVRRMKAEIDTLMKSQASLQTVEFLNISDRDDLEEVWGIGPKASETILNERPFTSYDDVSNRLNHGTIKQVEYHLSRKNRRAAW